LFSAILNGYKEKINISKIDKIVDVILKVQAGE